MGGRLDPRRSSAEIIPFFYRSGREVSPRLGSAFRCGRRLLARGRSSERERRFRPLKLTRRTGPFRSHERGGADLGGVQNQEKLHQQAQQPEAQEKEEEKGEKILGLGQGKAQTEKTPQDKN